MSNEEDLFRLKALVAGYPQRADVSADSMNTNDSTARGTASPDSSWTLRKVLSRAAHVARNEGAGCLLFKILGETCYRRLLLLEIPLDCPPSGLRACTRVHYDRLSGEPEEAVEEFLRFRVSDAEDAFHFRAVSGNQPEQRIHRRLAAGHRCFVARQDGRIVSASWIAEGWGFVDYLECDLNVGPETAYIYDTYTLPSFRGLNISPAMTVEIIRGLRTKGFGRLISAIAPENKANLRSREKVGFRVCGKLGYYGVLGWKHHFCRPKSFKIRRRTPWKPQSRSPRLDLENGS